MPKNDDCNHPNCEGGPCKALTKDELTPTEEDRALARRLVDEGWIQTSRKFRHIRRWKSPIVARDLIAPEHRDTPWGRRAIAAIERNVTSSSALHSEYPHYDVTAYPPGGPKRKPASFEWAEPVEPNPLIEERTLSPREFAAYRNECARRQNEGRRVVGEGSKLRVYGPSPEHWAASELGEWPGQPVRESPRTMGEDNDAAEKAKRDDAMLLNEAPK